ncbi:MAG: very short patch repair endonuclease [Methylococcaceae bacterium]
MTDVVDSQTRSRMMSGIRGKNTEPEIVVRRALFRAGFRFRLHRKDLPGKPDIVLPGKRVAIFVHGCFWHLHAGCPYVKLPSTRREFWQEKLQGNVERDARVRVALIEMGWRVLILWECLTRNRDAAVMLPEILAQWINGEELAGEISLPERIQ